MSDEKLISDFLALVRDARAADERPTSGDAAVAQLIGIVGRSSPHKAQAIEALAQCEWPLAVNFLSALTPPDMVFVPAGSFTLGSDENADEQPAHSLWLPSFYIDRAPMTNAQFGAFWEDVPYTESADAWRDFEEARTLIYSQQMRRAPYYWFDGDFNAPTQPVVGVTWYEAAVVARWAGKRLPSEAEWEKAARGADARRFPWGNEFDATRCNTNTADAPANSTTPPSQFSPRGDSPYGLQDMAGNVWEWTSSVFAPYPYDPHDGREAYPHEGKRVLRGGGFRSQFEDHYRCAYRFAMPPDYQYFTVGFRCAATVPPNYRV